MNPAAILLRAYYETLHGLLIENRDRIEAVLNKALAEGFADLNPSGFDAEKFDAYRDAALSFLAERIEMYNPIGIQYTFERVPTGLARQLELQLNWYDSTAEFEALRQAARRLAEPDMTDERLKQLAGELIGLCGAFPDKSIIAAYQQGPALSKLPDHALAKAIEQIIES